MCPTVMSLSGNIQLSFNWLSCNQFQYITLSAHSVINPQLNRLSQLPLPHNCRFCVKVHLYEDFKICSCSVSELTSPSLAMTSTSLTPDNKTVLQLADKGERGCDNTYACSVCSLQESSWRLQDKSLQEYVFAL